MAKIAKKPLEGIKIVELANYVAAPIVGRICADMGAEVIKIEGRGGDAWRATSAGHTLTGLDENPLFDIFNAGKKSITLNIKTPEGKEILFKLLEDADIFVTNTRHQSLVKLGIDYDSIRERFPKLIYAAMTGYGYKGPDCNAPGFDNIAFWSRSGFSADMMIQAPGSYPVNSRYATGDSIAGSIFFGSVMTVLYQRERTGKGDFVTLSLYDAAIWVMGGCILMAQDPYNHQYPEPRCFGIPMNLAYRCADGEWVRCTIFEYERYADKFFEAVGLTQPIKALGIFNTQTVVDHADQVVPLMEEAFMKKTSQEWCDIFADLDIVCGRLRHFSEVIQDEQAWANEYIQNFTCKNGAQRVLTSCPVRLGSQGVFKTGAPVMAGEHNSEILGSLGYSPEKIEELCRRKVLS